MIWDKLSDTDWKKAAPYVDTLLVPVIDINMSDKASFSEQHRHSLDIAIKIERQLTGRVMLMPPVSYVADEVWLQPYVTNIRQQGEAAGFSRLFFLIEEALLERVNTVDWGDYLKVSIIEDTDEQIRNLCEQIVHEWRKEV